VDLEVSGGRLEQSGGTNIVERLLTVDTIGHALVSGGILEASNAIIGAPTFDFENCSLVQSGGSVVIGDMMTVNRGGRYELQAGSLSVSNLLLGIGSEFRRGNVSFANPGGMTFLGGTFYAGSGANQLGQLIVGNASESVIDLENGGASVLAFRDSHNSAWANGGKLLIRNWAGSLNGGGVDRLQVGSSADGLNPTQLAQVTFVNPAGLSPSNYPARILNSGELVPNVGQPIITFSTTSGGMDLRWDGASHELYSSTNVAGPYQPVTPQPSSPYPVNFSEARRFFLLR
jgi:hypothetical protein